MSNFVLMVMLLLAGVWLLSIFSTTAAIFLFVGILLFVALTIHNKRLAVIEEEKQLEEQEKRTKLYYEEQAKDLIRFNNLTKEEQDIEREEKRVQQMIRDQQDQAFWDETRDIEEEARRNKPQPTLLDNPIVQGLIIGTALNHLDKIEREKNRWKK